MSSASDGKWSVRPKLRFGVFDELKGARTLLLWGDDSGIAALQAVFRELADGARGTTALHEAGWAEGVRGTRLLLDLAQAKSDQAVKVTKADNGADVTWNGTREEFISYADLIASLLDHSSRSGHQYLDSNRNFTLQIMVSRGEYPDNFR